MSQKFAILGLLNIAPMTGYLIKKNLELSIKKFWPVSYGGIYPALHKLKIEGLIDSKKTTIEGRTNIKYYITETGKEDLHQWLVSESNSVQCKDEYILKIFLSKDLSDHERQILLLEYLRYKETQFRTFQSLLNTQSSQKVYIDSQTQFVIDYTYHTLEKEIELIKAFIEKESNC